MRFTFSRFLTENGTSLILAFITRAAYHPVETDRASIARRCLVEHSFPPGNEAPSERATRACLGFVGYRLTLRLMTKEKQAHG
jgi:hypothetical protein